MPEFVAPEPVAQDRERARVATGDELAALLHHPSQTCSWRCSTIPRSTNLSFVCCWNEKIFPAKFSKKRASASRSSKAIGSSALFVFIPADRAWLLSG